MPLASLSPSPRRVPKPEQDATGRPFVMSGLQTFRSLHVDRSAPGPNPHTRAWYSYRQDGGLLALPWRRKLPPRARQTPEVTVLLWEALRQCYFWDGSVRRLTPTSGSCWLTSERPFVAIRSSDYFPPWRFLSEKDCEQAKDFGG